MNMVATIFVVLGVLLLVVAALGLFTLPNALARQHAATKSVTLALGLLLFGLALHAGNAAWWSRVIAIIVLLLLTMPLASHMLARAAARYAYRPEELDAVVDPETNTGIGESDGGQY